MTKLLVALALLPSLSVYAVEDKSISKIVSDRVPVTAEQKVRIAVDKGRLIIAPDASETLLTYRIEFVPNRSDSGLGLFKKQNPSQQDCAECKASYSTEKGLVVHTGKHFNAVVNVGIPGKQPLDAQLSAGVLNIGPIAGKVEAFVGEGVLEYDAFSLPAGVCVVATINAGIVTNKRDFNCSSVGATLHAHAGTISVK